MNKKKASVSIQAAPPSKPRYTMAELLVGAEDVYPLPPEEREWVDAPPVGKEWPNDED